MTERVDTTKVSFEIAAALKQLQGMAILYSTRGSKLVRVDLKKDKLSEKDLLGLILGPTGKLRAPSAKIGDALVVGFSEELYRKLLG